MIAMPTNKIVIVFDLGPGDGGKGGVVHKLAQHHSAHTVIKVGGAQGSHGVSSGRNEFAFSQWGCGTFEGVKTHITPLLVASPVGLLNEADALRYHGLTDAFDLLTIDERTICATPYHGIASRLREIALGDNPRGTIGSGVGQAYRDSQQHPELTIRASELAGDLRAKLSEVRDYQIAALDGILNCDFLEDDQGILAEEVGLLKDDGFLDFTVEQFRKVGSLANVVDSDYLSHGILGKSGVAIVESSHGVLTDNHYGFSPHVSAIRTLPSFTRRMLEDAGYDGEIETVGVHRAYSIRHGAGPLPTTDPEMTESLLPGSHKEDNRYQGKVRVGPLDLVLLRYAIDVCGGRDSIDGLAITWFDQIAINGRWHLCNRYKESTEQFFTADGRIRMGESADYQRDLCSALFECEPELTTFDSLPDSREELFRLCNDELRDKLGIPVNLVSFGKTEHDKLLKEAKNHG